jgi:hypothetical protein
MPKDFENAKINTINYKPTCAETLPVIRVVALVYARSGVAL